MSEIKKKKPEFTRNLRMENMAAWWALKTIALYAPTAINYYSSTHTRKSRDGDIM